MTPALRMRLPEASRSSTAAINPGTSPSSCTQGLRKPVISTIAVAPRRKRVPVAHVDPEVRVALDAQPREQPDARPRRLTHAVRGAARHGSYGGLHVRIPRSTLRRDTLRRCNRITSTRNYRKTAVTTVDATHPSNLIASRVAVVRRFCGKPTADAAAASRRTACEMPERESNGRHN